MAVRHGVTDSDKRFVIDPLTRTITNQSGKLVLIQYDHNSEQFTFECPRFVDGHDMTLCNKVEVHYINTGTGKDRSIGIFEADIPVVSEDNPNAVTFTWLVSNNATQYVGKLNFVIRFSCVGDEGVVEYAWNTGIYSGIAIAPSIYNGEEFVEEYVDVLEQWKQDLYSEGLKIASVEQTTTSTEDSGKNVITMTMTDGSIKTFEVHNGSQGRSIGHIEPIHAEHTPGERDHYEIMFSDGTSFPLEIYNGSDGVSIRDIMLENGNGLPGGTDRYAIHMTNDRIYHFEVYNGHDGEPGEPGESEFISSITRTGGNGSSGSIDTYTIRTSRNKSYTFKVYNGKDGSGLGSGSVTQVNVTEQLEANNGTNKISILPNGIAGDIREGTDESMLWISSNGHAYFASLYIYTGAETKEVATKNDITAAITGAIEGSY